MFGFFSNKSYITSGLLEGFIDCHSHILPRVDDGVEVMAESLDVICKYAEWGIREVWLTPHVMEDMPNTTEGLKSRFEELVAACHDKLKGVEIPELRLMAENMMDDLFRERLADNDVLTYGRKGDELLVETSYAQAPMAFHKMLEEVFHHGLTPVLAHPERYVYMDESQYAILKGMGVRFQLNITSLTGAYGSSAKKRAEFLLSNNYYSYRGTDCHNLDLICHQMKKKCLTEDIIDRLRMVI